MNKKLILGGIVLILVIGFAVFWKQNQKETSTETIRIGAVLGLTGAAATDSLNVKRGLDLAKEDLAKRGIVVDINYQDDKADAKQTVSAVQYLAATYKPHAIVGPIWSYLEEAAGPVIAQSKIVAYAPADTSEFVSNGSLYNFRGAPLNALIENPVADWLKENKKTRVAIIVSNDAWGVSVKKPFQAAAEKAGAEIVVDETIQSFSSNAVAIASTIMSKVKATKADVILWTGYEQDAATIAKKREELGIKATVLDAGTIYPSLVARGVITQTQAKDAFFVAVPTSAEFIKKFQDKYGEVPGSYADRAYDGLMILVEAIQNTPSKDPDAVAKYMRENIHYQGFGGLYEFNENGDVKGGKWVIKPITEL